MKAIVDRWLAPDYRYFKVQGDDGSTYILRHVLIHELGHHVAPAGLSCDEEEEWAEAFAFRYFTPAAERAAAAH